MNSLSDRINNLSTSQTLAMAALARELKAQGKIDSAPHLNRSMDEIITHGLENVGMYHAKRPLIKDASGNLTTEDMSLLYFYHNRLHGYGLEKLF